MMSKTLQLLLTIAVPLSAYAPPAAGAEYKVDAGRLHKRGTAQITVLPSTSTYQVKLSYKLKEKDFIPVPKKFLNDERIMEFPADFRTVTGYSQLEATKKMDTPKAELVFLKRGDFAGLKNAYFVEVRPKNNKSHISLVYHPSLPDAGWQQVKIKMISKIPVLDGYELVANLK
jgi:hypothetical protein